MICAESNGRRETLQQYFNEYDLALAPCDGFADFASRSDKLMLGVAPLPALAEGLSRNIEEHRFERLEHLRWRARRTDG